MTFQWTSKAIREGTLTFFTLSKRIISPISQISLLLFTSGFSFPAGFFKLEYKDALLKYIEVLFGLLRHWFHFVWSS